MDAIEALRKSIAEAVDELGHLASPKGDDGKDIEFTEDHQKAFDAKEAEIAKMQADLDRHLRLEKARAATATPLPVPGEQKAPAQPAALRVKGGAFVNIVQALSAAKGCTMTAAAYADRQNWADKAEIAKALSSSAATSGGFLVPEQFSSEVIELLRAETTIFRAGPRTMPMNARATVNKLTAGANGAYVGENSNITKEQQAFGQLVLTSKKLASLVPISNDLLRNSSPQADALVRQDLVAGMAVTADATLLRGIGTEAAPKGIRYWAASGNVTASAGDTAANIETDVQALVGGLQDNNSPMARPCWFMSHREYRKLYILRDANGNLIYPEVRVMGDGRPYGSLYGFPIYCSTSVPTNLGGGTESEVYLVDMAQVVVGEEAGIEISVSDTAAYHDGSAVVAPFSLDQTVIRAIMKHDLVVRHDVSIAVKTGVTWGA